MTPLKDPGFHRMEVSLRLNKLTDSTNPNEPDALIMDHETGNFFRFDEGSARALVPAIERFLKEVKELREAGE